MFYNDAGLVDVIIIVSHLRVNIDINGYTVVISLKLKVFFSFFHILNNNFKKEAENNLLATGSFST